MIDVTIVIVNYNTIRMTSECIESVINKTSGIDYEIILVDNASIDGSKDLFIEDKRITYIYNKKNLGFGRANNVGLMKAKGRNILFLNSDTILVNNAIKVLSDFLDLNEKTAAVGGNLYNNKMIPIHSFRRISPSITNELNDFFGKIPSKIIYGRNQEHNFTGTPLSVEYITGADLMIKKSILDRLGGFDERFFMYCEETELCYRIRKAGLKIMSVPEAKIIHLEGASFDDDKRIKRIKMNRDSTKLFCLIHYNKFYASLVELIWKTTIYSRIIAYYIINNPKKDNWIAIKKECEY